MEIIVTAFATLVAAGCFVAILTTDIEENRKNQDNTVDTDR